MTATKPKVKMTAEGIYVSLDYVPGKFNNGAYEPVDGIGTRYVASGKIRVYIGHHMSPGRRWISEDDAQHLGIALPPNPNAGRAPAFAKQVAEIAASKLKEPTDGDEQAAFFRARPEGECPCGLPRSSCDYHR